MNDDTLPFTDLPPPPKREWRKYTAENWERDHPEQAEYCLHLVREELILNVSELARRIEMEYNRPYNGGLRNVITAFLARRLNEAERNSIQQAKLFFARAEAIDKTHELVGKSTAKGDLGAVSMAMKLTHDVNQSVAGQPNEIREVRVKVDLEEIRERAKRKVLEMQVVEMLPDPDRKLPDAKLEILETQNYRDPAPADTRHRK
jgi:hypothetical protein